MSSYLFQCACLSYSVIYSSIIGNFPGLIFDFLLKVALLLLWALIWMASIHSFIIVSNSSTWTSTKNAAGFCRLPMVQYNRDIPFIGHRVHIGHILPRIFDVGWSKSSIIPHSSPSRKTILVSVVHYYNGKFLLT